MRHSGRIRRLLVCMAAVTVVWSMHARCEEPDIRPQDESRLILLPFGNPLDEFEPNTLVWSSLIDLSAYGSRSLIGRAGWDDNGCGRFLNTLLTSYFAYASDYYSHEVAHNYLNYKGRRLWVDLSNWRRGIPEFVLYDVFDVWDRELYDYYQTNPYDRKIYEWFLLKTEGGLYQSRFNARYRARRSAIEGTTGLAGGISFIGVQFEDVEYLLRWEDEPVYIYRTSKGSYLNINDVTGYVYFMNNLGVNISRERWLTASAICALASGQTWNSIRSIYYYLFHGNESVENLEFGMDKRFRVSPPNYYLFATIRGLYVDTETYLKGPFGKDDGLFFSLGTGLDAFGVEKTGEVDRLRVGGEYHSIGLPYSFSMQPFLYLDFEDGMRQIGHCAGATVTAPSYRRFFLSAKIQHSRGDMIEQTIMSRDEGFRFFAYLGYAM